MFNICTKKTSYLEEKFIKRSLFHIRNVQDNMLNLEINRNKLPFRIHKQHSINRSIKHDIDKFSKNMVDDYFALFSKKYYKHFDNEYYKLAKLSDRHYEKQRHHFYRSGKIPNSIDICEMCSDLDAIYLEQKEENNKFYYLNKMIKIYPNLSKYNKNILSILDLLEDFRKNAVSNENNIIYQNLLFIRKIQDYMIYSDLKLERLSFNIKKLNLINRGMHLNFNNIKRINIHSKITPIDLCEICCVFLAKNYKNDNSCLSNFFTDIEKSKLYKDFVDQIFFILKN